MAVIIKVTSNSGVEYVYGPFTNKEHAEGWAETDLQGYKYKVEDLIRPGKTFITCSVDDATGFITDQIEEHGEAYVTIGDVNWAVQGR
jgi:hypothetical protein